MFFQADGTESSSGVGLWLALWLLPPALVMLRWEAVARIALAGRRTVQGWPWRRLVAETKWAVAR